MHTLIKILNKMFLKKKTNQNTNSASPDLGYSTLLEYIQKVLYPSGIAQYTFQVNGFSDIPNQHWGYTCTYYNTNAHGYCVLYRHLSNCDLLVRGLDGSLQWIGDWKQIQLS
ncbi:MAG: hypothetical protein MR361_08405 [Clostridiales bacterium]|nr:hypothetical protein [Clostridiales bacterium]